jgi:hypothetical protein
MHEGRVAMMGGVLSGALSGLVADLAAGGLTMGAGTLIGALAGAAGGAGFARGFNVLRGRTGTQVLWKEEVLDGLVVSALLRYLAGAHIGRGRGEWKESEYPLHWRAVVQPAVDVRRVPLAALWARRKTADVATIEAELRPILGECARAVLDTLYPGALTAPAP